MEVASSTQLRSKLVPASDDKHKLIDIKDGKIRIADLKKLQNMLY